MEEIKQLENPSDHLANERTFLAWMRTSIGIMAFGFVVVKFALFVRQLSVILGKENDIHTQGYSGIIGIILVAIGAISSIFSYIRYIVTEKQLTKGTYKHSTLLITVLTVLIFLVSICLLIYLLKEI
jgi:putative membrane protein